MAWLRGCCPVARPGQALHCACHRHTMTAQACREQAARQAEDRVPALPSPEGSKADTGAPSCRESHTRTQPSAPPVTTSGGPASAPCRQPRPQPRRACCGLRAPAGQASWQKTASQSAVRHRCGATTTTAVPRAQRRARLAPAAVEAVDQAGVGLHPAGDRGAGLQVVQQQLACVRELRAPPNAQTTP